MAPKKKTPTKKNRDEVSLTINDDSNQPGMFRNIVVFLSGTGVQARRFQIWKQKLVQMGAKVEDHISSIVTHVLGNSSEALLQEVGRDQLMRFKGNVLSYKWLEDSLSSGQKISEDLYNLKTDIDVRNELAKSLEEANAKLSKRTSGDDETPSEKKIKLSHKDSEVDSATDRVDKTHNVEEEAPNSSGRPFESSEPGSPNSKKDKTLPYSPPDLNERITEIFGKLINIYRALGDDRRSFSYYKAIPVIEKLPFKIESVDQVKDLPTIGKAMQDHINEIVTTGKLSKLEHFETDEKVKTISLFGEVWGIGPATAVKLYDKGHRKLDDLKNDDSLTNSQKLGLKYFDDIKKRIPRDEVQEMELLLKKLGEEVLPGVIIVCGGSFRRGKATCGDMDIVITHNDGKSHIGFLVRYVSKLKDINFLREDLVFSTHSEEGTDSGVDTYFGLCTYPGREVRHRIDFKVYPRNIYAFGLIAWTGNDVLNRRLRILAESKGYRLDDTGLFLATQSSGGKRGARASTTLHFTTEKEVFNFLGFPWLEPYERNL